VLLSFSTFIIIIIITIIYSEMGAVRATNNIGVVAAPEAWLLT
jgi:uncharacterized membrane protein